MSPDAVQSDRPRDPTQDVAPDRPPDFLTVEEAARVLRVGRTSAYQLAQQWCSTDGREGLPVVRVGRLLRVPRHALESLAGGELGAVAPPGPPPSRQPRLPNGDQSPTAATPRQRPNASTTTTRRAHRDDRDTQASLFPAADDDGTPDPGPNPQTG